MTVTHLCVAMVRSAHAWRACRMARSGSTKSGWRQLRRRCGSWRASRTPCSGSASSRWAGSTTPTYNPHIHPMLDFMIRNVRYVDSASMTSFLPAHASCCPAPCNGAPGPVLSLGLMFKSFQQNLPRAEVALQQM